jgi:hypothetical protein
MRDLESASGSAETKPLLPRPEDLGPAVEESPSPEQLDLSPPPAEQARRAHNVRYIQPPAQPRAAPRPAGDQGVSMRDDAEARAVLSNLDELSQYDERKGVCFAFFVNRRCWEVSEAYCNHALHICMLRNCPVYHLHREDLEKRFSAKYKHLW